MKFIVMLFLAGCLEANGQQLNKTVTLHLTNVEFTVVLKAITEQTGVPFAYNSDVPQIVGKVTVHADNKKVKKVLDHCLKGLPLVYEQKGIVLGIHKEEEKVPAAVDAKREEKKVKVPDARSDSLSESGIPKESFLEEVLVIAYGSTGRRTSTGDIGKIPNKVLVNDRTADLSALLSGRIPRLLITQTNGLPESYYKFQLDGQAAVGTKAGRLPFTDPLFIVDGVPYALNNNSIQITGSGTALGSYGRSAMAFLDPNNIDHIEVLKDADATAIYGSRGARGVILITTKQGGAGKLQAMADLRFGIRMPTRLPEMLKTEQYMQMRHEALQNDSASPSLDIDKDLLLYDTTRYLDLKKELLGRHAKSKDIVYSFSGSKYNLRYYFGTNYHEETTVFPGSMGSMRSNLFLHLNYASPDQKLTTSLTANYLNDLYSLNSTDLTTSLLWSPNSPPLRNVENKTNWADPKMGYINPLAFLDQKYNSKTEYSLVSFGCNYQLYKKWRLKMTMGHNSIWSSEKSVIPIVSLNPFAVSRPEGQAFFGANSYKSFIAEPQIEYTDNIGQGQVTVLAGNSWQRITNENSKINAFGYTTDNNYSDTLGATTVTKSGPPKSIYNYQGLFGRINYNWANKYIVNLNGRMDWSSRDGAIRIRKNIAAVGAAWIFSKESFFKKVSFISFGKIRASYGITGNDPIGDMQYFDAGRRNNSYIYLSQLANSELSTELTHKLNIGIDLAFLHDQLFLSMTWFNNRTSNLVISPDTSIKLENWPVKIQNAGFDFTVRYESKPKKKLSWSIEATLTIPSNKLLSFPGLANSPYAEIFQEGKSLTLQKAYHFLDVNPKNGIFRFKDLNYDSVIDNRDLELAGNLDPKVYGGLNFDMAYRNWHFGFFIEGRVQTGYSYLNSILAEVTPGFAMINQPVEVLDRWQKPGDKATFQRFTTGRNSDVLNANSIFMQSDGRYANASFLRTKNIYLTAGFPSAWLAKLHLKQGSIHFQANNTFTFTHCQVLDPETQTFTTLPPLKTFLVGLNFGF
ncbi:hypothetical protein A3860_38235 [Niastella vici]|uniref:Secretin/TonB short N-terminal domain-containing protein n=1 Tax=Niastella vici TaxID=1703345 RepID=A0A1V9FLJ8_9BACT|nr:SusC/RagA family TonB-linked outer membrane protein [Niastella vici]OQP59223.1 hypothetical protein A3860_38235 [Niastella vici]